MTQSPPFRLFVDNGNQETGQPAVATDVSGRSSLSMWLAPEAVVLVDTTYRGNAIWRHRS